MRLISAKRIHDEVGTQNYAGPIFCFIEYSTCIIKNNKQSSNLERNTVSNA